VAESDYKCFRIATAGYDGQQVEVVPQLNRTDVWYLFDSGGVLNPKEPIILSHGKGTTINFASKDRAHYHEWVKTGVVARYFPTWSLEELRAVRPHMSPFVSEDLLQQRFYEVGGVIGHVYRSPAQYQRLLQEQQSHLTELSKEVLQRVVRGGADLEQKDVSGKVFSLFSRSPYSQFEMRMASEFVNQEVRKRAKAWGDQLFSSILQLSPNLREEYERRILNVLSHGGVFKVRPHSKSPLAGVVSVSLAKTEIVSVPSDDALLHAFKRAPYALCLPKSGEPVVDALCGPDMAFQITSGKSAKQLHVPKLKELLQKLQCTPERKLRLFIVSEAFRTSRVVFRHPKRKEPADTEFVKERLEVWFMADEPNA
jgi:hypothetical protein